MSTAAPRHMRWWVISLGSVVSVSQGGIMHSEWNREMVSWMLAYFLYDRWMFFQRRSHSK